MAQDMDEKHPELPGGKKNPKKGMKLGLGGVLGHSLAFEDPSPFRPKWLLCLVQGWVDLVMKIGCGGRKEAILGAFEVFVEFLFFEKLGHFEKMLHAF